MGSLVRIEQTEVCSTRFEYICLGKKEIYSNLVLQTSVAGHGKFRFHRAFCVTGTSKQSLQLLAMGWYIPCDFLNAGWASLRKWIVSPKCCCACTCLRWGSLLL